MKSQGKMEIGTVNGCIFWGTSLGYYIFDWELLIYLTSLFCIFSIYKLIKEKYRKRMYICSILMLLYWAYPAYMTLLEPNVI